MVEMPNVLKTNMVIAIRQLEKIRDNCKKKKKKEKVLRKSMDFIRFTVL